ncbi:TetR/AcrR family transcriptional regulator [Streptomyces sp. NPDC008196]|uniref:TetR/AcrR family transcriptional regulator n=1 Tax=Streptomyces sp. NPDC008196 TaxID=3364819 RepID=UPI0036EC3EA6
MSSRRLGSSDKPAPRSDGLRNRASLVAAARTALDSGEKVSLEGIARTAGVGIATLYRHFPTREALVEAVYSVELDHVIDSAAALLNGRPADEALRAWIDVYAAFVTKKQRVADTLRIGLSTKLITTPETRHRITGAVQQLLTAGVTDGTLRSDIEADDVAVMLRGVLSSVSHAQDQAQTNRVLELAMHALRSRPAP